MTVQPPVPLTSQGAQVPQPTASNPPNKKTWVIVAIAAVLVVYGIIANAAIRRFGEGQSPRPTPTPSATPTPTPRAIRQGKEIYTVSDSSRVGPTIWEATIDPHDPRVGEQQTITVNVRSASPVSAVTVELKSDNKITTYPLALVSGSATDGAWQGSWNIADTVLYTYVTTVHASDGKNTSSVDITMR